MNDLIIYEHNNLGKIRTIIKKGEPWFVLKDICEILEIGNPSDVVKRLNVHSLDKIEVIENTGFGDRKIKINIINEMNLYKCIMRSNKPDAEQFQDWVCGEVLPTIRKTGMYNIYTKERQKEAMEILQKLLPNDEKGHKEPYIKVNSTVNKAVSNMFGFEKMVKKEDMTPDMLIAREQALNDYLNLYSITKDTSLIKRLLYDKYLPKLLTS